MPSKYPEELRARATRLAVEARKDPDTRTGAISRIAEQTGVHKEALRTWVRSTEDAELPTGDVDSVEEIRRLQKEVWELRRSNAILKSAAAFSQRSSTAHRNNRPVHRRAPAQVGRRTDLPNPERGVRTEDRALHVLRIPFPAGLGSRGPGHRAVRAHHENPYRYAHACLRDPQDPRSPDPRRPPGCALHRRTAVPRARNPRDCAGEVSAHHEPGPGNWAVSRNVDSPYGFSFSAQAAWTRSSAAPW